MDRVQLFQGCKAIMRRQFAFDHEVPRNSCYSFDRTRKNEKVSQPWSHPVVLNPGLLY